MNILTKFTLKNVSLKFAVLSSIEKAHGLLSFADSVIGCQMCITMYMYVGTELKYLLLGCCQGLVKVYRKLCTQLQMYIYT